MGKAARVPAIDVMRGFVIVLMALDHVRDYFGPTMFDPTNLEFTSPPWFWTRWITHLCATTFVLLAGSSAFLRGAGTGIPALSRYLATRGLMLIALEVTWITFSWQFGYDFVILQVLWALGVGMIVLAGLAWLPRWAIALVAALLIVPHNLLDPIKSSSPLWMAWHQSDFLRLGDFGVMFRYPLMPWIGLIAAGYALGPVFQRAQPSRQRVLWIGAAVLLLAFMLLRAFNIYGDPHPWVSPGRGLMFDLMAFVNVEKYPPSLQYILVTCGIGLMLLALFDRFKPVGFLQLIGRVPMFFYVIHIALTHLLGNLYFQFRFGRPPGVVDGQWSLPAGYEPSLLVVYLAWVGVMIFMYALCRAWTLRGQRQALARAAT